MKKLAIPAILAFWLVILGVAMVFRNRPDYPPHPPPPDIVAPGNVELVQDTSTTEITGWPRWDPEGNGIVTSDLPCGPADGGGKGTG